MNHKRILSIAVFLLLTGCAAREEPYPVREPKQLIIKDDYDDLEIKPRQEEPVQVDHKKEGVYRQNFENVKIIKE